MNNKAKPDRLLPDGRLDLPEVTLVAATSKALHATIRALGKCLAQIRPAGTILFSDIAPPDANLAGIRHVKTDRMESREAYSEFMLNELAGYIETDFALCVQWDGYVLSARNWCEEFLAVDYIGATWPQFDDGRDVGNGGFSLRSIRLLRASADKRIGDGGAEDVAICRNGRRLLECEYGVRFASRDLARRFSYERTVARGDEFGFHGVFNMAGIMPRTEFREILSSLDPGVLRRADKFELLKDAARRCDFKTLRILLDSMLEMTPARARHERREGTAPKESPRQPKLTTRKMYGG